MQAFRQDFFSHWIFCARCSFNIGFFGVLVACGRQLGGVSGGDFSKKNLEKITEEHKQASEEPLIVLEGGNALISQAQSTSSLVIVMESAVVGNASSLTILIGPNADGLNQNPKEIDAVIGAASTEGYSLSTGSDGNWVLTIYPGENPFSSSFEGGENSMRIVLHELATAINGEETTVTRQMELDVVTEDFLLMGMSILEAPAAQTNAGMLFRESLIGDGSAISSLNSRSNSNGTIFLDSHIHTILFEPNQER